MTDDDIDAVAAALRGRRFGTTRVLDAHATRNIDVDGEPAVFIHMLLNTSDVGFDAWPADDITMLHLATRLLADELGIHIPMYLHLRR